jgi:hypothetical protein
MSRPVPILLNRPQSLGELFPELVEPLKEVLLECERISEIPGLAATVDQLEIHGFCGCGDDFCGSFYTVRPPHWVLDWTDCTLGPLCGLGADSPFMSVDLLDGAVAHVEITCATAPLMETFKRHYEEAMAGADR